MIAMKSSGMIERSMKEKLRTNELVAFAWNMRLSESTQGRHLPDDIDGSVPIARKEMRTIVKCERQSNCISVMWRHQTHRVIQRGL